MGALIPWTYLVPIYASTLYNDYHTVSAASGPVTIVSNPFIDFEGEVGGKPVAPFVAVVILSLICGLPGGFVGLAIAKICHWLRRLGERQRPLSISSSEN